jgi:hypothetical protein
MSHMENGESSCSVLNSGRCQLWGSGCCVQRGVMSLVTLVPRNAWAARDEAAQWTSQASLLPRLSGALMERHKCFQTQSKIYWQRPWAQTRSHHTDYGGGDWCQGHPTTRPHFWNLWTQTLIYCCLDHPPRQNPSIQFWHTCVWGIMENEKRGCNLEPLGNGGKKIHACSSIPPTPNHTYTAFLSGSRKLRLSWMSSLCGRESSQNAVGMLGMCGWGAFQGQNSLCFGRRRGSHRVALWPFWKLKASQAHETPCWLSLWLVSCTLETAQGGEKITLTNPIPVRAEEGSPLPGMWFSVTVRIPYSRRCLPQHSGPL